MLKRILIAGVVTMIFGASFVLVGRLFSESEVILAKVGNFVITQGDFEEFLGRNAYMRKNKPYSPEEKKAMLDNLIRSEAVVLEAEKEKLDEVPLFKSRMKLYRVELLVQDYFAKNVQPTISMTDEEIDAVIKENPALQPGETLHMKEIMVKTEKEAEAIYEELKKGADFSKMAVDKSKADTRVNGGTMRPVTKGILPKPLEEVAFSLKKGEISKPIKTEKGVYILYMIDRKEKTPEELEKFKNTVREKVKQIEMGKKEQAAYIKKAEELKSRLKVEAYYDRIPK
jgi:peptidyl-prolyl cis-trans isomerase C